MYQGVAKAVPEARDLGLIPRGGGYSCNQNYNNKALMWILHREQTDGCTMMHARNGREFRIPEFPATVSTVIARKPRRSTNFWDVFGTAVNVNPMRDHKTMDEDTLAERYERTV